ncbi:MAG: FliM/FliN family flagellar motor switch protein [Myxococcales bacterium]|nr:FliM/FliN family flagellar motor switch protein [Myxococcales bacterium]
MALSPAEEGLFAWLVLGWLALLPGVRLAWVHGGAPAWPLGDAPPGGVAWRVTIAGELGGARWWLPADAAPSTAAVDPALPLRARIEAGHVRLAQGLAPGDLVYPAGGLALACGPHRLPLTRAGERLVVAAAAQEPLMPPALDALPVRLDVVLGHLELTVGALSALRPGQVLPVPAAEPVVVTLCAGERPVAQGVLVEDAGRLAVQVTRSLWSEQPETTGIFD